MTITNWIWLELMLQHIKRNGFEINIQEWQKLQIRYRALRGQFYLLFKKKIKFEFKQQGLKFYPSLNLYELEYLLMRNSKYNIKYLIINTE